MLKSEVNQEERHWSCPLSPNLHNFLMKSCSTIFKAVWDSPRCAWSNGKKKNLKKNLLRVAKTWQNLLKSQRKQSCPFCTTLQHSNESQTWPHGEVELQHAGVAWVLLWDLCLACISNFLKKVKQGSALEQKSIFIFISHHLAALQWVPNLATCWSWAAACWCCMGFALGPLLTYLVYMQTNAEEWSQPRRETLVLSFKPKLA